MRTDNAPRPPSSWGPLHEYALAVARHGGIVAVTARDLFAAHQMLDWMSQVARVSRVTLRAFFPSGGVVQVLTMGATWEHLRTAERCGGMCFDYVAIDEWVDAPAGELLRSRERSPPRDRSV